MEQNSNKQQQQQKAPRWLKLWGAIAFFSLFIGAAEEPGGGICFWWTFGWVAHFGVFAFVSNHYDWDDGKEPAKETEGAE